VLGRNQEGDSVPIGTAEFIPRFRVRQGTF
jgi:hypothetical protein